MPEACLSIIDALIEKRHKKGMTQKQLAEASNFTQSVIARLESKKATPQINTLVRVAHALGCEIAVVQAQKDVT